MWFQLGKWVLRFRFPLLLAVLLTTALMTWVASKVQLSYEFARAIPVNNPKYVEYQDFKKQFGEDGNLMVIGFQSERLFELEQFRNFVQLQDSIKKVPGVEDVLSVSAAVNLIKDTLTEKLKAVPVFPAAISSQEALNQYRTVFEQLPFYKGLLYNPQSKVYMLGVRINKEVLNSKKRTATVERVVQYCKAFGESRSLEMHYSGLPLVRTVMSTRIADEMRLFLLGSVLLSAVILFLFFRSLSAMWLSMAVVVMGVIWSLATIVMFGYKITLLNALIPPLIVVIGIPNCIYFLNKFHTEYKKTANREIALVNMMGKMGVVTLFCNIAAAIGFAVFGLTESAVLKEFGVVAGINIMVLFVLSFIFIPVVLSYLPAPKERHVRYLENERLNRWLMRIENWVFHHPKYTYTATAIVALFSIAGILQLKSVGFIVDDLPKNDVLYTDLKFFEKHFAGVMPLEIVVDTRKKRGVSRNLDNLNRIDSLVTYLENRPEMGRALALTEGLKFAGQAYYDGDSAYYKMPNSFDFVFLSSYLRMKEDAGGKKNSFSRLVQSFVDSTGQRARISINMADVGSDSLPKILATVRERSSQLFDTSSYSVQFTGTSVTFLEGSSFIINGLKESIVWAFLLIAACMLYLFRSMRILICSLIPNIIPLLLTAGVMGWMGVPLKPSTVLVFSVALGIAIDVTIRFLINYKQELPHHGHEVEPTVRSTIKHTGISIIYTSLVLVAGFIIFCFSGFGGTQALGWLTSLTLLMAMITNLILLPVLLLTTRRLAKGEK
jgi:predicted RND superfamily exporter protein